GNAYVTEGGALDYVVGVRTDKEADVRLVAEGHVRASYRHQGIAEAGRRQDVAVSHALELNHVRCAHGRADLLGRTSGRAAELQRHEPVSMDGRRHVRRAALEAGAHAPPELAMRLHARPVELCPRGEDDIPLDAPPHEMEGVPVEPHVRTRPRDRVARPTGVVDDRAPLGHLADV